ncbi:predicted protein [Postia placenta Mad-698-R]|nr:predicted protein [Postia placenta Mad-698-R]
MFKGAYEQTLCGPFKRGSRMSPRARLNIEHSCSYPVSTSSVNTVAAHRCTMTQFIVQQVQYLARQGPPMHRFLSSYTIPGSTNAGIHLASIEQEPSLASLLQDATQPAFPSLHATRPSFRIHIVGYRPWFYQMHIYPERGGLTIEQAAIALTRVIRRAYNDYVGMIGMPGGVQFGPTGITFEQLYLVEVHQVSSASIQLTLAYEV